MSFKFSSILVICLLPFHCIAQIENEALMGQIMEYIAENVSDDQDYSEITEQLSFYRKHPLNINTVERDQLKELVFISPIQIDRLIAYRKENGLFQDLLELQAIDGFDREICLWLMNFVVLNPPELLSGISLNSLMRKSDHDLMIRIGKVIEKQKGFMSSDSVHSNYSGAAERIFTRYRFNYENRVAASVNMEKDAGEPFLGNSGRGFDFYSANVSIMGGRFVKKIIIGDYALQFGQGLTMWSGLGFGKGAALTTVAKQALGLRPYSSVNESSFLRGASATIGYEYIFFTPFVSYTKLDATLSDDRSEINSLSESGLHRTLSERKNRNVVSQSVYGLNSAYVKDALMIGITAYRTQLDKPIAQGNQPYEKYNFHYKSLTNTGLYYTYTHRNTYLFGEAAHSFNSGSAFLGGLMSSLSNQVSGVFIYRNYGRNYHSFFNQGLSESTEASNEKGFYSGLTVKFDSKFELASYFDFFRFPWLKFRVDAPSQGYEFLFQFAYSLSKRFKFTARVKHQVKEENINDQNTLGGLESIGKQNYRLEIIYKAGNSFSFRNRAEVSSYQRGSNPTELGFLSYQDILYSPLSSRFSGNFRFALFDTPSFNSRIYAYENDVLYSYSVSAYQGRGLRCYVNGRFTPRRGIDIWVRYALLSYSDQETVGSGNDLIFGNHRSDIKLQLRFQF